MTDGKEPLVSFCIATLGREYYVKKSLEAIFLQSHQNFEAIISDNDSSGRLATMLQEFDATKIIYNVNDHNIGMIPNFMKAFSLSKGELICFMADDDPPTKDMLSILIQAYNLYPNAAMYYGSSAIQIESSYYENISNSLREYKTNSNELESEINLLPSYDFIEKYITGNQFNINWSSGIAQRKFIEAIGGIPDFGSGQFSDIAYMIGLASQGDAVVVKRIVANWTFHEQSETTNLHKGSKEKIVQEWAEASLKFYNSACGFLEVGHSNNLVPLIKVLEHNLVMSMIGFLKTLHSKRPDLTYSDIENIFKFLTKLIPFSKEYEHVFLSSLNFGKTPLFLRKILNKLPPSIKSSKMLKKVFFQLVGKISHG